MVHGASIPALAGFDLRIGDHDWRIKHGSVDGFETAEFLVGTDGILSPCERVPGTSACVGEP